MPLSDFLRVLDEEVSPMADPADVLIVVSGGEPLMRKDLEQAGREFSRRGYPWGLVTNGLAMTPERFRALRDAGLVTMSVSLDGLEATHNAMRQHPLAYESAIRTIRLAAEEKMCFDVVTCVTRESLREIDAIRDLLLSLGVMRWRTVAIDPMGRAADDPDLLLTGEEHRQLLDKIAANRAPIRWTYGCGGFLGEYEGVVRNGFYHCAAGVSVASVLVDGSISACTSIRGKYYQGNIYRDHFREVWENGFELYRNRAWMKSGDCGTCKMWRYCQGNGMHLRREDGSLMRCHLKEIGLG